MSTNFPNIDFGFRRGNETTLFKKAIENGTFNVTKDTRKLFVDIDNARFQISDIIITDTEAEVKAIPLPEKKIYLALDTKHLLVYDFSALSWSIVGCNADYSTKAYKDNKGNVIDEYYYSNTQAASDNNEKNKQIAELSAAVSSLSRLKMIVIESGQSLPSIGEDSVIYLIDETTPSTGTASDIYAMYIWVTVSVDKDGNRTGYYAKIGGASVDLSTYYTKSQTDSLLTGVSATAQNAVDAETARAQQDLNTAKTALNQSISSNTASIDSIRLNYLTNTNAASTYFSQSAAAEMSTNFTSAINAVPARVIQIIASGSALPTTGVVNALYLVDQTNPSQTTSDSYEVYIWISTGTSTGYYCKIGESINDLAAKYATVTALAEANTKIDNINAGMATFEGVDEG